MKINNISFGAKIPIAQCKIKDNKSKEFVNATFYEIDCKDKKDIKRIENLSKDEFKFATVISENMELKKNLMDYEVDSDYYFYTLETDDDNVVGICQTEDEFNNITVKYIASNQNRKHKYVGQNMLAIIGKKAIASKKEGIEIFRPINSALKFYKKCGFKNNGTSNLIMKDKKIPSFIKKAERKTKSPIIFLNA